MTFGELFNLQTDETPLPGISIKLIKLPTFELLMMKRNVNRLIFYFQDWQNGVRCTLVNRDKSLTSSLKSGRLFLTAKYCFFLHGDNIVHVIIEITITFWFYSYLCFERSKTQAGKNIVIPLERIRGIEKGNQYAWIPGGGMIIEVFVHGLDRVYIHTHIQVAQ